MPPQVGEKRHRAVEPDWPRGGARALPSHQTPRPRRGSRREPAADDRSSSMTLYATMSGSRAVTVERTRPSTGCGASVGFSRNVGLPGGSRAIGRDSHGARRCR
jgi:hypothetical protein